MVKQGSTWEDIAALSQPAPDLTTHYGPFPEQIGDWFLPKHQEDAPTPVILLLHGGCWLNSYDRRHLYPLAKALLTTGAAVCLPEYRRVGDVGGGWPGTFSDVLSTSDHIADQAKALHLDTSRVIVAGHSAGGHLALWLNSWVQRGAEGPVPDLKSSRRIELRGCLGLAAIADLTSYWRLGNDCAQSLPALLGGDRNTYPERWVIADPMTKRPIITPIHLVYGENDTIVPPEQAENFMSHTASPLVKGHRLERTTHFDAINPEATAFATVAASAAALLL